MSTDRLQELLEENKRLHRINFGRLIAVGFFMFYAITVWTYLTSTPVNSKCFRCSAKDCSLSKLQKDEELPKKQSNLK